VKNKCSWFTTPTAQKGGCSSSWSFPAEPSMCIYIPAQMGSSYKVQEALSTPWVRPEGEALPA